MNSHHTVSNEVRISASSLQAQASRIHGVLGVCAPPSLLRDQHKALSELIAEAVRLQGLLVVEIAQESVR